MLDSLEVHDPLINVFAIIFGCESYSRGAISLGTYLHRGLNLWQIQRSRRNSYPACLPFAHQTKIDYTAADDGISAIQEGAAQRALPRRGPVETLGDEDPGEFRFSPLP